MFQAPMLDDMHISLLYAKVTEIMSRIKLFSLITQNKTISFLWYTSTSVKPSMDTSASMMQRAQRECGNKDFHSFAGSSLHQSLPAPLRSAQLSSEAWHLKEIRGPLEQHLGDLLPIVRVSHIHHITQPFFFIFLHTCFYSS